MSHDSIPCDLFVDISGTDCAIPFSTLNDALKVLLAGQTLMAVSKKQALQSDIPAFCRQRDLQLVEQGEMDNMFYFLIKLNHKFVVFQLVCGYYRSMAAVQSPYGNRQAIHSQSVKYIHIISE